MDIVRSLDFIACHVALLLLLVVILKFVTKRLHLKKADVYLMKIHKPASHALVIAGVIHMFTSLQYLSSVGILSYVASYVVGLISLIAMIGAIYTFRMRKSNAKRLFYHRVLTVIAIIACLVHPMLYFELFSKILRYL